MKYRLALAAFLAFGIGRVRAGENWPQAAGPNGSWTAAGPNVPLRWSVSNDQNIVWRTPLPEVGQGGIAVWGDRVFLTTMKPLAADAKKKAGRDVVGYCLDGVTGKILWSVDLPGAVDCNYAYGFSDPTTPSPITDGLHVWFYNSAGAVGCWDFSGRQVWLRQWHPTEHRPFNKQFEPILEGDTVLNMEPRDEGDPKREAQDPWNYLRGLDKLTGKTLWVADDALTHYNTPMRGTLPDGTPAVLQGRGAYHGSPEAPTGLSMTSLAGGHAGQTLWRFEGSGRALYTMQWDRQYAYWLTEDGGEHQVLDVQTGKLLRTQSLSEKVDWRRFDPVKGGYVLQADVNLKQLAAPLNVFPAWFTNIVVTDTITSCASPTPRRRPVRRTAWAGSTSRPARLNIWNSLCGFSQRPAPLPRTSGGCRNRHRRSIRAASMWPATPAPGAMDGTGAFCRIRPRSTERSSSPR